MEKSSNAVLIAVPSAGRAGRWTEFVTSLPGLFPSARCVAFVPEEEVDEYVAALRGTGWYVEPDNGGIAETRFHVMGRAWEYKAQLVHFFDDDLHVVKGKPEWWLPIGWAHVIAGEWGAAGLGGEAWATDDRPDWEIKRPAMNYAISVREYFRGKARFNDVQWAEDWHVILSLNERGMPTYFSNRCTVRERKRPAGTGAEAGGCFRQRTPENLLESARDFVRLHPEFSKIVPKPGARYQNTDGAEFALTARWVAAFRRSAQERLDL